MLARIETIEQFETALALMRTGNSALYLGLFMTLALGALAGIAAWRKDERLAHAARRGQYALFALTAFCCALLYVGIFEGYYFVNYIERVTENNEEFTFKLAALWASQQGSLLFWCFILTGFGAAFAFTQRHNRTDRRLPFTLIALAIVQFFFFFIITSPTDAEAAQRSSPFSVMYDWMVMTMTNKEAGTSVNHSAKTIFALLSDTASRAPQHGWELLRAMHESGHSDMTLKQLHEMVIHNPDKLPPNAQAVLLEQISDGNGMNPALHNYWVAIHPPMLYLGFVGFTIPFCYAVGSLLSGEVGEGWLKPIRLWTMASWGFLTVGIALGGLWAYEILGWGGYWAWDPVENASFVPWLTGTAFIHSVIVTERRGMLRLWSFALIIITYCMTVVGTFLVRSGIINSVHAFGATGDVDAWFYAFLGVVFMGPLLLLIWRKPLLAPDRQLESVWSREGSFLFNNLIFLAIGLVTLIITGWPLITETLYGETGKQELGQDAYVMINVPLLLVVLVLMGIGPALAWQRNSLRQTLRMFAAPLIAAALVALVNGLWLSGNDLLIDADKGDRIGAAAAFVRLTVQLMLWPICAFTLVCILMEFAAGARARARGTGEGILAALLKVSLANRRRYGGYVVHIGVLLIALGIYYSSFYESEGTVIAQPGGYGVIENRLTGDRLLVVYETNDRSESWDFMKEAFGDEERAQLYANMLRYVRMNPGLTAEQIVDTVVRDTKAQMGGELPPQMQNALPRMQAAIAWGIEQRERQVVYETFRTTLRVYPYEPHQVDATAYRQAHDRLWDLLSRGQSTDQQFAEAIEAQGDEAVLLGAELPALHRTMREEFAQLDSTAFAARFGIDLTEDFVAQRFRAMQRLERLHEMIEGYAVTRRNDIVAELAHKLPDEKAAQTLASMRPLTLGGLHKALAETHPEKAQHIRAEIDATVAGAATVTPQMRIFYDKRTGVPRTSEALKDPQYHRTPSRDAYFILQDTRPDGTATFRFFVKPQMTLGLAGLAVVIAGTVMAFLPSVRRRKAVAQ